MRKKERRKGSQDSPNKRDRSSKESKFGNSKSRKERRPKRGFVSKTSRSRKVSNFSKALESRPS